EGLVRAIGVSNFKPAHLERLRVATGILPAVNQVQLHPLIARPEARVYHAQHGIVTESWSPVEKGGDLLSHPAITDIAEQHRKTPAQVVLRWHLELGLVPIPKSADPGRMRENIEVFDFTLTTEEIAAISALNRGEGAGADSDRIGH
ncbi:MAG: aldo/keto reductase, partial [Dehalococcoidia bacterium]